MNPSRTLTRSGKRSAHSSSEAEGVHTPRNHRGITERAVRRAVNSEGRSLENGVRKDMQSRLAGSFKDVPCQRSSGDGFSLGGRHSANEDQAEQVARASDSSRTNGTQEPDLSNVVLHTGSNADAAARAVDAEAFAVGNHVVSGKDRYAPHTPEGRRVLVHELTHTQQPAPAGLIQRVGFFESLARFFGGGTFSDEEIKAYLDGLEATDKIEDEIASDNKARAAVDKGLYAGRSPEVRALLVLEMLSGYTGGDDREKILVILQKASDTDRERIVDRVTIGALLKKFTNEEDRNKLYELLNQVKKHRADDVNTEWAVGYKAQGAEELRPSRFGLVIDRLSAQPTAADKPIIIATDATNSDPAGAPAVINSSIKHPHGEGGTGFVLYHVAARLADGSVAPVAGGAARMDNAPYAPITLDNRTVTANIDITFESHKTGETTATGKTTDTTGRTTGQSTKTSTGQDISSGSTSTSEQTTGKTKDVTKGTEQSKTTGKETTDETTGSVTLTFTFSREKVNVDQSKIGGEFSANGTLLAAILAVAEPEAIPLLAVLKELGVLDSTTFKITGEKGSSETIAVRTSREVQTRYEQRRAETTKSSETFGKKEETKTGEQSQDKKGTQVSTGKVTKTGKEQESSVQKSQSKAVEKGEAKTRIEEIPVIKDSKLAFAVKQSKGQPPETDKPAAAGAGAAATGAKEQK